ncbi:Inositol 2-dehydrogenase/D-chiro-inositol 3-dehydrogenase [Streptomyces sp. RB5]|uniref:Inositol 2-dehydrogenase n=1 Tax=Streptomyces smaragdinus TaxID=2585196 RepID=A0A7K0CP30_9ACTN|nr:Gfo/Idh/MocA family oxidoreductase [Streptomyces smaragdinus]MQY14782.1 Inositol 2-dehydrogenase/D-chiro-inositol 3-dehydrogenase [Streptomyces smaragdinus]
MTVRIGVIGTGAIGRDHIDRVTRRIRGASVTAVTDLDRALAEKSAGEAKVYPDGAALIASPEVDAVLVACSDAAHAEHVLTAIAAGKPVLCEKPLAVTPEDCLRIMAAEESHGSRLVQVGFMRRYDAGYREMHRVISAGDIGRPLLMHCAHRNRASRPDYTTEMAVLSSGVHEIDAARWLLSDEIVSTQVINPRSTRHRLPHLTDPQFMLFETASGIRIDLEVFVNCRYGYDIRCETVGEEGLLRLPDPARPELRASARIGTAIDQEWDDRFSAAFDAELQAWVDSVPTGRATGPSSWDGYAATAVATATVRAQQSGDVEQVNMRERPAFYA